MANPLLDQLGKQIIEDVRDSQIHFWELLLHEKWLPPHREQYRDLLKLLNVEQIAMLYDLGIFFIDGVIHDFLLLLESEWIKVSLHSGDMSIENLGEMKLGELRGLIFEWAEKFSKKPLSDIPPK